MTTETTTRTSIEQARAERMNAAYLIGRRLGRPFQAEDVTSSAVLAQAARDFAHGYKGTLPFMLDQQANVNGGAFLTPAQAKGVLNCLMAEARRRLAEKATAQAVQATPAAPAVRYDTVPSGKYTVVFDAANPSDYLTVELAEWENFVDRRTGQARDDVRSFKYLAGPDNTADFMFGAAITADHILFASKAMGARQQRALEILATSTKDGLGEMEATAGAAYAFASGRCWRCHRELTVEDSVAGGIGPVCAKRVDAEYGTAVLDVAKRIMARLQGQAAPAVEAPAHNMYTADGEPVTVSHDRYTELFGAAA